MEFFKKQSLRNKAKSVLQENKFVENTSNFKSGAIQLSSKDLCLLKLSQLDELSGVPTKNQQFRIVTQKQINSFDFILAILANENISELIIAFYRIGKKVIVELKNLLDENKIQSIHFLVNDAIPKLTPDAYNLMKQLEAEKWTVRLEHNHTKIILIKTDAGNHYIIEGSGNLSQNARIEQYVFDNDQSIFEFHKSWIIAL